MSYLLVGLFELHDKSKFDIIAFSFGPEKKDEIGKKISGSFSQFIKVNLKTDKQIAQLSRELKIDIAIDLMCYTANSRIEIFSERCAPIQINYLGYPVWTMSAVNEMRKLTNKVKKELNLVKTPALIIHSEQDKLQLPTNTPLVYNSISSKIKEKLIVGRANHNLFTSSPDQEMIFQKVVSFLNQF